MLTEEMISANEFCIYHNIDMSFIISLKDSGLINISTVGEKIFVSESELSKVEKLVRLYYEMDINLEGIETITYLLQQLNKMQEQVVQLNNKLRMYENEV